MRFRQSAILFVSTLLLARTIGAAEHPVETQFRMTFPTISLESSPISDDSRLKVSSPRSYDEVTVVESGNQRIVLRALGAKRATALESRRNVVYEGAYEATDAMQTRTPGRHDQFLLLHDERAPLVYDYAIVESRGITSIALQAGAIQFFPGTLQFARPSVVDASGKRSTSAAQWSLIGDGRLPHTVRLTITLDQLTFPVVVQATFLETAGMAFARADFTLTLLASGKVLAAGGAVDQQDARAACRGQSAADVDDED